MVTNVYDTASRKKATNLSVNADLLRRAKALGINISQLLESRLAEVVRERQREAWLSENREAIEAYNRRIRRAGAFSDGLRRF